jgi:hypothetical protein
VPVRPLGSDRRVARAKSSSVRCRRIRSRTSCWTTTAADAASRLQRRRQLPHDRLPPAYGGSTPTPTTRSTSCSESLIDCEIAPGDGLTPRVPRAKGSGWHRSNRPGHRPLRHGSGRGLRCSATSSRTSSGHADEVAHRWCKCVKEQAQSLPLTP